MQTTDHSFQPHTPNQNAQKEVYILCCLCGTSYSASATGSNICLKCLSSQTDITSGITKTGTIEFCKFCNRYNRPPWIHCELESKEMLALCLSKLGGLNKAKLIDASFIWTEPHSKRIKVKITIQKEVMNNISIQQSFPVEFTIVYHMCTDCHKSFTPHTWAALVQVRQKVEHKRTFFLLEQMILKHSIHDKVQKIKETPDGLDFYFKTEGSTRKLLGFLASMFPTKVKHSKQLISADEQNSIYNYKYVTSVEIPKVCKEDLVILTPKVANALGGCSKLLVCHRVSSVIQFLDPINMKIIEMSGPQYFQHEGDMTFISSKGNTTQFMIFDVDSSNPKHLDSSFINTKFKPANITLARESDWDQFEMKTYLGDILNVGDTVIGYDLTTLNLSGHVENTSKLKNIPPVVLVKKIYPEKKKVKKRFWRLKQLDKEEVGDKNFHKTNVAKKDREKDYEEFLNELEADPELRAQINLYKDEKAVKEIQQKVQEHGPDTNTTTSEIQSDVKEPEINTKKKAKAKGKRAANKKQNKEENKNEEDDGDDLTVSGINEEGPTVKLEELLDDLNADETVVKVGLNIDDDTESTTEKNKLETSDSYEIIENEVKLE